MICVRDRGFKGTDGYLRLASKNDLLNLESIKAVYCFSSKIMNQSLPVLKDLARVFPDIED